MTLKRVIFVRPGETEWNLIGRWQGWLDVPLNEHGLRQIERLANFLRHIGPGAIYTSDLRRAVQTAQLIGDVCGQKPIRDVRLRERNIGRWQGMTLDEVRMWFPDEYQAYKIDRMYYAIPNGESLEDVRKRMRAAFDAIVREDTAETVVVVSHTVSIRTLLDSLIEGFDAEHTQLGNSSVTTIERNGEGWRMVVPNDVMHLEGLEARVVQELEDKR